MRQGSAVLTIMAAAICARGAPAGEPAPIERVLLASGVIREGRVVSLDNSALTVDFETGEEKFLLDEVDPAFILRLRLRKIAREGKPSVRLRFQLAADCLRWGFLAEGRSQLEAIGSENDGLDEVVGVWLRDFPVAECDVALRSGIEALLNGEDEAAYSLLSEAVESAAGARAGDLTQRYLVALLKSGFKPGKSDEEPPLSRELRTLHYHLQKKAMSAHEDLEQARLNHEMARSLSRIRDLLSSAESRLESVREEIGRVLAGNIDARGRKFFEGYDGQIERQLLALHLKAAEILVAYKSWSDAARTLRKAHAIDPANPTVRSINSRLPPGSRIDVD